MDLHSGILPRLLHTQVVRATVCHTNLTIPLEGLNFVSGPNVRSTLSILWSSLLTILLCTWTIQHLALPPENEDDGKLRRKKLLKQFVRNLWKKLKWMLVAIVMPEFLVGRAAGGFIATRRSTLCKAMQGYAKDHKTQWTMAHAFYANMGGFVLTAPKSSSPPDIPMPILYQKNHISGLQIPIAVNSAHLCMLMEKKLIKHLPSISKDAIKDKSKEDFVVKLLVLGQVLWLFIQLIERKLSSFSSTQLEIAVFSFAACTFITYIFLFGKPKDIRLSTKIVATRGLNDDDKNQLLCLNRFSFFETAFFFHKGTRKPAPTIPNDSYNIEAELYNFVERCEKWTVSSEDIGIACGAVIFGVCHCIAWNFEFPTPVEQILWRIAGVFTAAIIPLYYFGWFALSWVGTSRNVGYWTERILVYTTYTLCTVCRLYIMTEAFRSLFYLPPEAFVATWSGSIPHIG
ncbi:hypothetical protein B0J14DRAFT_476870 [Halenospora varia]|nr:hypothetical protein B0J14DRAFT_476870 [Halenospora varia]